MAVPGCYETVGNNNSESTFSKYKEMSNQKLKSVLKNLKSGSNTGMEIKFVARLLRLRLNKDGSTVDDSEFDHENRFKQNF